MMVLVEITNLTSIKVDQDKIIVVVKKVMEVSKIEEKIRISIVFIGPRGIKKINKEYRGENRVTDILSFNFQNETNHIKNKLADTLLTSAEIFICLKEIRKFLIKKQGIQVKDKEFQKKFEQRVIFVLIHGLLHFLGYHHQDEEGLKMMEEKQRDLFSIVHTLFI